MDQAEGGMDEMNIIMLQDELFANDESDLFIFDGISHRADDEPMQLVVEVDGASVNDENNNNHINNNNKNNNNVMIDLSAISNPGENGESSKAATKKKWKKFTRHTEDQIRALAAAFIECPHPDEARRKELSQQLGLDQMQVKFWFQNKRNMTRTKAEHDSNILLKAENEKLRTENEAFKRAVRHLICPNCQNNIALASSTAAPNIDDAQQQFPPMIGSSSFDQHVPVAGGGEGANNIISSNYLPQMDHLSETSGGAVISNNNAVVHIESSWMVELALNAMNELLLKIVKSNNSLWIKGSNGISADVLNYDEYSQTFPPVSSIVRHSHFVCEATKTTDVVISSCQALVEMFMNSELWMKMFPNLISTATTIGVVTSCVDGTLNLMEAELQVLTPLLPLCKLKFLRYCKQYAVGKWAVADVSVYDFSGVHTAQQYLPFQQLPSGCIIEQLSNGSSKVTWVAHYEYDEKATDPLYGRMMRAGLGFGSTMWLATLKRRCECIVLFTPSAIAERSNRLSIPPKSQRGLLKLGQSMSDNFCYGICSSKFQWANVQTGTEDNNNIFIKSRISIDVSGQPSGIILSAATSFWLDVATEGIFNYLKNRRELIYEDIDLNKILHLPKGPEKDKNFVALFGSKLLTPTPLMVIQETWSDASSSGIVYASFQITDINAVCDGRDITSINILPCGFAIHSDGKSQGTSGALLTIGLQVMANDDELYSLSINHLNNFIRNTSMKIKADMG